MISRDSLKGITSVIAVGLAIFQIYFTAGFGIIDSQLLRTIHLGIVLALVFLYFPPKKLQEGEREHPGWLALDLVLICGAFATAYFLASDIDYYMERIRYVDPVSDAETVCATAAVLLVLEATRRVAGLPLVIVASAFLAYGLGGQYLPGILRHDGVTYKMLCEQLYLVTEGLYGIPLAVSSTMIFAFVMFGCFLQRAGLGQVFLDLACVLTRRSKGGPAKVSIFASALFGSISGSAVANVYSTGTFTIPLMKRVGYTPSFAGAVEAVSSTGGQLMPPIMGATAFVMADVTGAGYLAVAKAALLPSLLYYFSLLMMIHFEAVNKNIGIIPSDQIPDPRSVLRRTYHILPIIVLIGLLVSGRSVISSAFISIASVIVVSCFSAETESRRSRYAEEEMSRNLHTIEATTEIVQLLDSDEQIELTMNRWVKILAQHIQVDSAEIFQLQTDTDKMNVAVEWLAPGQISYFDKTSGIPMNSFLHTEKPLVISTDSVGKADSEEIEKIGMKAVMIFPILKQDSGIMKLSLIHRRQAHLSSKSEI